MSENTEERKSIVPLVNFSSDVNSVRLNNRLSLRRIDLDELEFLTGLASGYQDTLKDALLDVEYVIEKRIPTEESEPSLRDWNEKSRHVQAIVLALRLLDVGDVSAPTAFKVDSCSFAISETSPPPSFSSNSYFLTKAQIKDFKALWKKVQKVKQAKPYLDFPLIQFTKAYDEKSPEDAILDYMIAFESLVFHGERKTFEGGKVIGISIGMLIGNNQKERTEIKKKLVRAYEVRNANKSSWQHRKTQETWERCRKTLFGYRRLPQACFKKTR